MRYVLGIAIWLLDFILKLSLGTLVVACVWWLVHAMTEAPYDIAWIVAGKIVGLLIVGFFEGCDFVLVGLAKRVWGDG